MFIDEKILLQKGKRYEAEVLWTTTCTIFTKIYTYRYVENFFDAFWIWTDQTYELKNIYLQGEVKKNLNIVDKILIPSEDTIPVGLYNPNYHNEKTVHRGMAVKVTHKLTEVFDSIIFALPVLTFLDDDVLYFYKNICRPIRRKFL